MVFLGVDKFNNKVVIKKSNTLKEYDAEKKSLLLLINIKYIPKLLYYNDKELYLVIDFCGRDLRNESKIKRETLIPYINKIHDYIEKHYKIYHNDIRWKNITILDNKVYLIDWGMSSFNKEDKNHDKILNV
jgi:tRNA A-37 threonylcarbamoyl transferase component Bud32